MEDYHLRVNLPDLLNNRMEDNFNNSLSTMSLSSDRGDSFDLLINQLNQNSEANILSVPRIVTRSGEEATLRVGEIHYFPEVYEGDSSQGTLLNISYEDFDEKFLGIELNVIPRVEDNKITLQLNPSITELNGGKIINLHQPIRYIIIANYLKEELIFMIQLLQSSHYLISDLLKLRL